MQWCLDQIEHKAISTSWAVEAEKNNDWNKFIIILTWYWLLIEHQSGGGEDVNHGGQLNLTPNIDNTRI